MSTLNYRLALVGDIPAEALTTIEREDLVVMLWGRGWSDNEIARHTRMTLHTTARIRYRLELPPHGVNGEFDYLYPRACTDRVVAEAMLQSSAGGAVA